MKCVKYLVALALIACVAFAEEADEMADPGDIVELNGASYTKFVKDNKLCVVMFYAPWCGHCKAFKPEYERIATALKEKEIPCGRIDGDAEGEISNEVGIEGFPTIMVYVDGKPVKYDGPRTKDGVLNFIEMAKKPPYVIVTEKKALDMFLETAPTAVIGYIGGGDSDDNEIQNMFLGAANAMHFSGHAQFAMVSDPKIIDPEADGPIFELRTPDLLKPSRFNIEGTDEDAHLPLFNRFTHWISSQVMPVLGEINQDTYQGYVDARLPFVWFVVADKDDEALLEKYSFVREIGRENIGKLTFVMVNGKTQARQVKHLGFEMDKLPGIVATDRLRYHMTEELTADNLRKFLQDYIDNKIEPTLKSQEVPTPEAFETSTVKTVVSKNWKEVVFDEKRDVLVKYYAEWCGHCKAFAPDYIKVAALLAGQKDKLYLAEMNFPENELKENVEVQGFPTVIFYPAASKDKPIVYKGDRSVGNLLKFLQENKSFDWEMPELAKKEIEKYEEKVAKEKAEEEAAEKARAAEDEEEKEDPEVILQKLEEARKKAAERDGVKEEADKEEL